MFSPSILPLLFFSNSKLSQTLPNSQLPITQNHQFHFLYVILLLHCTLQSLTNDHYIVWVKNLHKLNSNNPTFNNAHNVFDKMLNPNDIRDFSPELPINFTDRSTWGYITHDEDRHISHELFNGYEEKVSWKGNVMPLANAYQNMCDKNRRMMQVVDDSGWHHVCKVKVKHNDTRLAYALLERWWDTTHTFHLSSVEVGFTPHNFTVFTGIPVGRGIEIPWVPIHSGSRGRDERIERWTLAFPRLDFDDYCDDRGIRCSSLKIALDDGVPIRRRSQVGELNAREIEGLRIFFLLAIGELWFPNNRKIVACEWFDVIMDVDEIATHDWGSAIMANMYRGLDRASRMNGQTPECCWFLLQYWFYEHIGQPAPMLMDPSEDLYPRILRWAPERHQKKRKGLVKHDTQAYRLALEQVQPNSFLCNPFVGSLLCAQSVDVHDSLQFSKRTILDRFNTVQFYLGERLHYQLLGYFGIPCLPPNPMHITKEEFEHWVDNDLFPIEGELLRMPVYENGWLDYWAEARKTTHLLPGNIRLRIKRTLTQEP